MKKTSPSSTILVFLDRDGVITTESGEFITRPEDITYIPGSLQALRLLKEAGILTAIVSNQSGVGRGMMSQEQLMAVHDRMMSDIRQAGGRITIARYCPHKPDEDCECRKPKAGMLEEILKTLSREKGIIPENRYIIGDNERDITAGKAVDCEPILVLSGCLQQKDVRALKVAPKMVFPDLLWAVRWLLAYNK